MTVDLTADLGAQVLESPLVAASGTVGNVVEFEGVTDFSLYGAAVAKSVSRDPWPGHPPPRLAPSGVGMLNSVGIQNPGIEDWIRDVVPRTAGIHAPVWGSAVGRTPEEFASVASEMAGAGIPAIEINLSCPNLDDRMFALDAVESADVVTRVRQAIGGVSIGAKLSPNAEDIVGIVAAVIERGADWVVLTNTAWGAGIDVVTRRPSLSATVGGLSGPPLKPMSLRCVIEVSRALPDVPIIGCGGVTTGRDVVEYLMAGASAVAIGSVHFAEPRAARRIMRELKSVLKMLDVTRIADIVGVAIRENEDLEHVSGQ